MIGWSCHFRHCCTSHTCFPLLKSRERAAAKRYAVVDNIIQTLKFEDGVAPWTDLRGVPEPSHYGDLVFAKKKEGFPLLHDKRRLHKGSNCSILKEEVLAVSKAYA